MTTTPQRREQRSWYFYDFANSAYASTVLTLFMGPYLTSVAKAAAGPDGLIRPFGIPVEPRAYWGYLIALSVFLQIFCLPVLGAIADYSPRKKQLLGLFAYLGAACTIAKFWVMDGRYLLGGMLFVVSNLAFGAAIVIYNSFLADIATESERDTVSSRGWGIGYLGGGLLLALNLALYSKAAAFGISEGMAVRISLASAGIWWALFSIIPMAGLRNRYPALTLKPGERLLSRGFLQVWNTIRDMRRYPQTATFLIAYLIYNDGIQSVISLSAQFGNDELGIPMSTMTAVILMVQFVAFFGALGFNALAARIGAKRSVITALVLWTAVLIAMYAVVRTTPQFFAAAAVVALIMGGSQALSRSLFSLMIPRGREAEYFSLYEVSDKGTSWLGPLLFGLALQFTHSYRVAILSLIVFFVAGLVLLARVNVERAAREAGNQPA